MMTAVTQWIKVQKYFVDFIFALASAAINQVQQEATNFPICSSIFHFCKLQCSKICKFGKKATRQQSKWIWQTPIKCLFDISPHHHCHWALVRPSAIFNRRSNVGAEATNFHRSLDFRCKGGVGGKYNQHIQLCRSESWFESFRSKNDFFEYLIKVSEVN